MATLKLPSVSDIPEDFTLVDPIVTVAPQPNEPLGIHRRVIGLFAANVLTLLVVGLSFLAYSRLLDPSQFGLYAVALSAATLLALVLDGGLKTTIIKLPLAISTEEESSIAVLMVLVSVGLLLLLLAAERPLLAMRPGITQDARFITFFVGIALLFYPFITLPTAKLERDLEYGHIAWIESLGTIIERGGPAVLLLFTHLGLYSFVWALLVSRIMRVSILASFHRLFLFRGTWPAFSSSLRHLREGAWIQAGTISAVARDNLHVLLIGPLFGKIWIGYYAWALQICLVSSQIFAQISARVSLPLLAQADTFQKRWTKCLYQVRLLAILTVPVLCGVWLILPTVNSHFFQGKWQPALALVPLLFLRMIPGMATTPVGPLIMVHRGGFSYALANLLWTFAEILVGLALIRAVGPTGLAWSYALLVWLGLWLMVNSLRDSTSSLMRDLVEEITLRPSLLFAVFLTVCLTLASRFLHQPPSGSILIYWLAGILILSSYLLAPELRGFLSHGEP
jgi:O-antigen/teichoic acid export membrane protein